MPLYDYHCTTCDKEFELLIRSADTPACPSCGTVEIRRLVSCVSPPGRAKAVAGAMRTAAGREGHLSNFGGSGKGR